MGRLSYNLTDTSTGKVIDGPFMAPSGAAGMTDSDLSTSDAQAWSACAKVLTAHVNCKNSADTGADAVKRLNQQVNPVNGSTPTSASNLSPKVYLGERKPAQAPVDSTGDASGSQGDASGAGSQQHDSHVGSVGSME